MLTPAELAERVVQWGSLKATTVTDESLLSVCGAAIAYVSALPVVADRVSGEPSEAAYVGMTMLAARLYKRKDTPSGLESFGEWGSSYVSRYDPDIATLLRLKAPSVW